VKCATHSEAEAIGTCVNCGKAVCPECSTMITKKTYCSHCADDYDNMKAPAAAPQIIVNQSASASSSAAAAAPALGGAQIKNPGLAAIFSLFWPGAGQIYNGQVGKGIATMVVFWITVWVFVGFVVQIWAVFDAYNQAKLINARGY
jgi:TM2 domain-containing membrane protein YozV